jgi:hypothetical protein
MTNAEKFEEVFGFSPNKHWTKYSSDMVKLQCSGVRCIDCPFRGAWDGDGYYCEREKWWNKAYKEKPFSGVKVGDELVWNEDNIKAVVTDVNNNGECVCVITENGSAEDWCSDEATKTGRHFPQIAEVLKQMKED